MSTLGGYKVHPIADKFPLLDKDKLIGLAEDIKINGLINPIVLDPSGDVLVDGRNRWLACDKANVTPVYTKLGKQYGELEIIRFIFSSNIARRHLNPGQAAILAVGVKPLLAEAAKERQRLSDGRGQKGTPKSADLNGEVSQQLASMAGVGNGTVKQAMKVTDKSPRLAALVLADELSLNEAYEQVRDMPDEPSSDKNKKTATVPNMITLLTHEGKKVPYQQPKGKAKFNATNEQISWSAWSWNPVTGCIHGCPYCYAREMAYRKSYAASYPVKFTPLFHHERLDAPANTEVPKEAKKDPRLKRVFVCSMADLYGKWVPKEWIERVHESCVANPQWDYLMLTKFPRRYVDLDLPKTAWIGTSVDEQKRVRLAEEAFRQIKNVRVKWLSLEPLLAPLEFSDLSMFDWIVIGSQSATEQPDGYVAEFAPPFEWVARLVDQAREAGCRVYLKPNLLGEVGPQWPGMQLPQEEPKT